ncbi:hypothetical protein [uncultured Dysosmobacter sp.]|uniref:hypothetical protein n=1 Tax=uncultured Dysosmobacter sp. TaxID=2591384 RepID=UPI00260A0F2D|nr:hypothetical protein [uncultured Dysosmobacter sp.]
MSTLEKLKRFQALDIDFSAIGLEQAENAAYFCTPVGAEYIGWIGCDGVHFVLLPGDERVFCVDPMIMEEGRYVLPVAESFQEFLSFVLFCRDANPLTWLSWMEEARFRQALAEDAGETWDGCEAFFAKKNAALETIASAFGLEPEDPYEKVKALQRAFDPSGLRFSRAYYDVLGLEEPGCPQQR